MTKDAWLLIAASAPFVATAVVKIAYGLSLRVMFKDVLLPRRLSAANGSETQRPFIADITGARDYALQGLCLLRLQGAVDLLGGDGKIGDADPGGIRDGVGDCWGHGG
mgnify:CR=1 FL=1